MAKRKTDEPKRKPGGQSKYTEALGDRICELLAGGAPLNAICKLDGMPSEKAVRLWSLDADHPFAPKYARAREAGYRLMADELVEIADNTNGDPQRDRLRLDTRKWLLSKALPKVYGDKLQHTGDGGGDVQHQHSVEIHIVDHRPADQD